MPLPGEDAGDAGLADFERRQDDFEEQSEKMLMAVYDALYKACRLASLPLYLSLRTPCAGHSSIHIPCNR